MGRHAIAQDIIAQAFASVIGRPPTKNERLFAGAIALGESGYGEGVYKNKQTGEAKVLNNWGAVQCKQGPPCPEGCWEATDYNVKNGVHTPFQWCYQDNSNLSRVDAAAKFLSTLYKSRPKLLAAADSINMPPDAYAQLMSLQGDDKVLDPAPLFDGKETKVSLHDPYYLHIAWFSHVMRDSKYFGMELVQHIGAQIRYHNAIAADTGERIDGGPLSASPKDLDLHYSHSEWLSLLALSLSEDAAKKRYAKLPPETDAVLRRFQLVRGLKVDGIPGPKTLKALFAIT